MAYCVRCGVELMDKAAECPLCRTPVLLPADTTADSEDAARFASYPDRLPEQARRRPNLVPTKPVVVLATFLLLIPFLITMMVDLKAHGHITWAFYPMTSLGLLWLMVAYPALLRKHPFAMAFTVDTLAIALFLISLDFYADKAANWSYYPASALVLIWVCGMLPTWLGRIPVLMPLAYFAATSVFLWCIEFLSGSGPWFFTLAMPLAGAAAVFGLGLWLALRLLKGPNAIAAVIVLLATLLLFVVDGLVERYVTGIFQPLWSPVVSAVGLPLAALLFAIHLSADLRAFLQKKFHM